MIKALDRKEVEEHLSRRKIPLHAKNLIEEKLRRLENLAVDSEEYQDVKLHLSWLLEVPWDKTTQDQLDIEKAEVILDSRHVGRIKLKRKILEYISIFRSTHSFQGVSLCFVGPPGVGKLNLCEAMAEALGRNLIELRFAEYANVDEFLGYSKGKKLARPSRILRSLCEAGSRNPVIVLNLAEANQRDWTSEILDLIDPEKNLEFWDDYLGLSFDLSEVLFLLTTSDWDIAEPLFDRVDSFQLNAYTPEEKMAIAKNHLFPEITTRVGLHPEQVKIPDLLLQKIIQSYTLEAGVNNLERQLRSVARAASLDMNQEKVKEFVLTESRLGEILGQPKFFPSLVESKVRPGIVTGLSRTFHGGEISLIEVSVMPGKGRLILTGQIGDVMRESAKIAVSYLRAEADSACHFLSLSHHDIHIHVPFGSVPKEGPSAGITILTALASLCLGKPVDPQLAMTGEITLRGAVLRVGSVKEKLIAAHRAGIKQVLIPSQNAVDLVELTEEVRSTMKIELIETVDQALEICLNFKTVSQQKRRERMTAEPQTSRAPDSPLSTTC